MKISQISCTQFAGLRGKAVELSDGLNLIIGRNESGKSTVANLISGTLLRDVRLDGRSDKDFISAYFPAKKRDGKVGGDFIDGSITFESEGVAYTLKKEWCGADSRCTLVTPDGVIRDSAKIDEILKNALVYGRGVYAETLLSSKRIADSSLRILLDKKASDEKSELAEAVTSTFAESGGVSIDSIEKAINDKIEAIAGQHWNAEKREPARRTGGARWQQGLGEILRAKYELEDVQRLYSERNQLEDRARAAFEKYTECKKMLEKKQTEKAELESFAKLLLGRASAVKLAERHKTAIAEYERAAKEWPTVSENTKKGRRLLEESRRCEALAKYNKAKTLTEARERALEHLSSLSEPTEAEIKTVKSISAELERLEGCLGGMNICAALKTFNSAELVMTVIRTGERITLSDGLSSITEAVRVEMPGVFEMTLTPADVDVEGVKIRSLEIKTALSEIFDRYGVSDIEGLRRLREEYARAKNDYVMAKTTADMYTGGVSLEELYESVGDEKEIRSAAELNAEISILCKGRDLSRLVIESDTAEKAYIERYGSIEHLSALLLSERAELCDALSKISKTDEIPEKYLAISDPEQYLDFLARELDMYTEMFRAASEERTASQVSLERYSEDFLGGRTVQEIFEELTNAERRYNEALELLDHWMNIARVFAKKKAELSGNPMSDIARAFEENLAYITGGNLSTNLGECEKLDLTVFGDDSELDYVKLSDGTKETVLVAFRLAVLEHLFPNGGGVMIFDDPFVNMDSDRCRRACELIREISKKHQVLFLACRDEYEELLSAKRIRI